MALSVMRTLENCSQKIKKLFKNLYLIIMIWMPLRNWLIRKQRESRNVQKNLEANIDFKLGRFK